MLRNGYQLTGIGLFVLEALGSLLVVSRDTLTTWLIAGFIVLVAALTLRLIHAAPLLGGISLLGLVTIIASEPPSSPSKLFLIAPLGVGALLAFVLTTADLPEFAGLRVQELLILLVGGFVALALLFVATLTPLSRTIGQLVAAIGIVALLGTLVQLLRVSRRPDTTCR